MAPYASPLRNAEKVRVPPVQSPTLQFFLEGDELEAETRRAALESARGFQNDNGELEARTRDTLVLRDRDLGPLNPYDSFENHARARGALIGVAMLSSLAAMGVAGWMWMTSPTRPGLDWFQRRAIPAVTAFAGSFAPAPAAPAAEHAADGMPVPAAPEPTAAAAEPAPVAAAAEAAPAPQPTPVAPAAEAAPAASPAPVAAAAEATPAAQPAPVAAATEVAATARPTTAPIVEPIVAAAPVESARGADGVPAGTTAQEPAAVAPRRNPRSGEGKALRGYVWSPAANTLVTSNAAPAVGAPQTGEATPVAATKTAATKTAATKTAATKTAATRTEAEAKTAEPVAVPSNPDAPMPSSLLSGPGIAAPSTGPAPDETARVPTTEPSPFPAPALPDTKVGPATGKTTSSTKAASPIID